MKKKYKAKAVVEVLGGLLLGVVLLTTILVYAPALAQLRDYNPQGLEATTLEEVLALPDDEIDLATAIMILYKEWDPSFDVIGSLEEIDRLALELELQISPDDNPERIVSLLSQYIFKEEAYSCLDPADPLYMKTSEGSALPCVIANKKGDCLGLSLLYLALAERLGLPIYGVTAPAHVFVRYDDGETRINIETTDRGRESEDSYYEKKYMLHPTYRNHNFYLRNLLKGEVIGVFLSNLGAAYHEKGMYNDAIVELKEALEINPSDAGTHYNLGVAYDTKGMYDKAIAEYRKAIEINPNDAKAYCNLGIAYYEKGMYDKAITEFERAVKIDPTHAEAHHNLGLAYDIEGMDDEAIAEYKKALEINPDYAETHCILGIAYYEKGMYDRAIAEFKKAIKINPNDARAHFGLGIAYYEKGMDDKAIVELRRALEIDPNDAKAHYNLAAAYYYEGEYSLAIEHCDRAIELGHKVYPGLLEALKPYRTK